MRGPFWLASPDGRMAATTARAGASRTSSHVGNRARSASNARPLFRSLVCWLRIQAISSPSASPRRVGGSGSPYDLSRRLCTIMTLRRSAADPAEVSTSAKYAGRVVPAADMG